MKHKVGEGRIGCWGLHGAHPAAGEPGERGVRDAASTCEGLGPSWKEMPGPEMGSLGLSIILIVFSVS